jgi:hypothetical protein
MGKQEVISRHELTRLQSVPGVLVVVVAAAVAGVVAAGVATGTVLTVDVVVYFFCCTCGVRGS